jgi:hypothetical protein
MRSKKLSWRQTVGDCDEYWDTKIQLLTLQRLYQAQHLGRGRVSVVLSTSESMRKLR